MRIPKVGLTAPLSEVGALVAVVVAIRVLPVQLCGIATQLEGTWLVVETSPPTLRRLTQHSAVVTATFAESQHTCEVVSLTHASYAPFMVVSRAAV